MIISLHVYHYNVFKINDGSGSGTKKKQDSFKISVTSKQIKRQEA